MATDRLINLILLFFTYAFLGWCIEVTLKYFQFHRFINRGFLEYMTSYVLEERFHARWWDYSQKPMNLQG